MASLQVVFVPRGAKIRMILRSASIETWIACECCQLIVVHRVCISCDIFVGLPPKKMYAPGRAAIISISSCSRTQRGPPAPTASSKRATDQKEGGFVPSLRVTYIDLSL